MYYEGCTKEAATLLSACIGFSTSFPLLCNENGAINGLKLLQALYTHRVNR